MSRSTVQAFGFDTPGPLLLLLLPLRMAGFKLVSVAPGPEDRVVIIPWLLSVRVGREVLGVLD